jgi:ATP/maltotriose-dependent transcriptional regulator MalT
MHPDTAAAIRLVVLALENHPEDLEILQVYGDMAEHIADLVDDYLDDDD